LNAHKPEWTADLKTTVGGRWQFLCRPNTS